MAGFAERVHVHVCSILHMHDGDNNMYLNKLWINACIETCNLQVLVLICKHLFLMCMYMCWIFHSLLFFVLFLYSEH